MVSAERRSEYQPLWPRGADESLASSATSLTRGAISRAQDVGAALGGRHAVGGAKRAREVRRVSEAPAHGDRVDRLAEQPRVEQVRSAAFQPPLPDPGADAGAVLLEKAMQLAHG